VAAIINPLRDEPNPIVTAVATRFGLVGLVACAICASSARLLLRRPLDVHVPRAGAVDLSPETILKRRQ
jgi:hypothetical protein